MAVNGNDETSQASGARKYELMVAGESGDDAVVCPFPMPMRCMYVA
jgi:hypothetical protein